MLWYQSSGRLGVVFRAWLVILLGAIVPVTPVHGAMTPSEITFACNSLARMAFDLKDLVNVVATKRNPGPFQVIKSQYLSSVYLLSVTGKRNANQPARPQDILDEFNDISESCLSNISVMIRSSVVTEQGNQQLIYEAYSNVSPS